MGRSLRGEESGVGRYARNLIAILSRKLTEKEIVVFLPRDHNLREHPSLTFCRALFPTPNEYARAFWEQAIVPFVAKSLSISVYHSPNYILPLALRCPCIVTIHDVIFMTDPWAHRRLSCLYLSLFTTWAVRRANRLLAISNSTASELIRLFPQAAAKTTVIYPGIDPVFHPPQQLRLDRFRHRYCLHRPFILYVGTLEPRKNLVRLIKAFEETVKKSKIPHDLVFCGPRGWKTQSFYQILAMSSVKERIRLIGYVNHEELPLWYAAADLFVYPSLTEGFGLPPLEAMACGTPVVTSSVPALMEAVGDAAVSVNPYDVKALVQAITEVIQDRTLAEDLRMKGLKRAQLFDWGLVSDKILTVYRELDSA
jgi:glycosyltransferase involved in cell wall biosynthesis